MKAKSEKKPKACQFPDCKAVFVGKTTSKYCLDHRAYYIEKHEKEYKIRDLA